MKLKYYYITVVIKSEPVSDSPYRLLYQPDPISYNPETYIESEKDIYCFTMQSSEKFKPYQLFHSFCKDKEFYYRGAYLCLKDDSGKVLEEHDCKSSYNWDDSFERDFALGRKKDFWPLYPYNVQDFFNPIPYMLDCDRKA